jgi:hypothetical protein
MKEGLLFVNKKKQKNFIHSRPAFPVEPTANGKSFFASFCSQKEDSSFLGSAWKS